MAYSSSNPVRKILDFGFASGGSLWAYSSTHVHSDIEAANFFAGCGVGSPTSASVGMRVGDLVSACCVATSGTSAVTWHRVTSISTSTGWGGGLHASVSVGST
ncbi:hypothetical protein C1890_12390 [Pseudomonas sp. DP16D-R1]|nr:hypothetical protein C1890_12390 [Pseudomonas sp. DP16D-R1]